MVIAGHELSEEQIKERIAYLQTRVLIADQHCDDALILRLKDEIAWILMEMEKANGAA